jgi:hypothetical protein
MHTPSFHVCHLSFDIRHSDFGFRPPPPSRGNYVAKKRTPRLKLGDKSWAAEVGARPTKALK